MNDLLAALGDAIGADNVLVGRSDLERYETDGRQHAGRALAVVRPATTSGVSAILRLAAQHGVAVIAQGARTGLVGAGLADDRGEMLVLSLERLSRVIEIDAANRSVTAEGGALLSTINAAAHEDGLFFPIDLGADPSVGGMIAANTGGARFLRYGDVRRNLLGLEIVLADGAGTVLELGGALWKNNVGVDLKQLVAGTSGAFGVVTRATLALQPRPAAQVTALVALRRADAATGLAALLEAHFGTLITAFEGMSANALAAAFAHVPRLRNPFPGPIPPYAVLIELSSGPVLGEDALEHALGEALAGLIDDAGSAIIDVAVDRRDALWAIRHAIPEGLRASGQVIACDIALRRGDVMRFRDEVAAGVAARWPGLAVCDFGHIGDGGLHFNLVWPGTAGALDPAVGEAVRDYVFATVVEEFGGSFSAEHGIGPRNIKHYARFVPEGVRRVSGQIQRLLAPQGLGRVDFGSTSI
ncbi:FAD-binding oxidoreductase [Sphingomonas sp. MMSM20]|uniref:FAD-binding oxidoreductase n=1 Tax=Sphingomonas lycopersici TaxID=2951807 RepID=UPI0022379C32|nr:FAD-binding oxidoreductase [Sphingomonas lycopersici]MCW6528873.1 FAD-binding oxidoreductase [Sphingomonas lycopersici]